MVFFPRGQKTGDAILKNTTDTFKKSLVNGLKAKFNIDTKVENLKSVLSPDEFIQLISQYSKEDFSIGNPLSEDTNEFFKNVIDGKFRITLHGHTVFSDGHFTPEDFINQAAIYADKVARKLPSDDKRPAFVIALTDHDNIEGSQEIVKIIAQNPDKYKNLRFVSGAELGVRHEGKSFDLTALAVNPFDETLNKYLESMKLTRQKTVNELIPIFNQISGFNYTFDDLEKKCYRGKKTLTNKSGVIFVCDVRNIYRSELEQLDCEECRKKIEELNKTFKAGSYPSRDIPNIEEAIKAVKAASGFVSWTHPVKSFKGHDEKWFADYMHVLNALGVDGVEANQQYTYGHYNDIPRVEIKNESLRKTAEELSMFISGGTDSHQKNIFGHHHKIDEKTLALFLG